MSPARPPHPATVVTLGSAHAPSASVEVRITDPAAPTVIAFAGMGHGLQMPVAEFARALDRFAVNVLFVKDLDRCWYQHGIRGLGASIPEAAHALEALLPDRSALAATVGTSSGGTGAILFGAVMRAPVSLAFSPRTLVDAAVVARWRDDVPDMPPVDLTATTADLRRFLATTPHGRIVVHVGADNAADVAQVARIGALPGVAVRDHPTDWHASAAWLRDEGRLARTLADELSLPLCPGQDLVEERVGPPVARRDWRPGPMWRAAAARWAQLARRDGR